MSAFAVTDQNADRVEDILDAACLVISRSGSRALRMQDVAKQAGASKALVHYYFKTREELLARAYSYVDAKNRAQVMAQISPLEHGATRLARLLLFYFDDEASKRQEWVVWLELSAVATFDPNLRPTMEASFRNWIDLIERTIRDGIADGSIPRAIEPSEAAIRLTALIDGLGAAFVRGLVDRRRAQEVLARSIALELGRPDAAPPVPALDPDRPSAARYFRRLAGLTKAAVEELTPFAATAAEREAIEAVCALVEQAAGDQILRRTAGDGAKPSRSRRRSPRA